MEIIDIIDFITLLAPILILIWGIRSILRADFMDLSDLSDEQLLVLSLSVFGEYLRYSRAYDAFLERCNEQEKKFVSIITCKQTFESWMFKNRKLIITFINEIKG